MTVMKHKGRFDRFKREYINTLKQLEINKKKYINSFDYYLNFLIYLSVCLSVRLMGSNFGACVRP